MPQYRERFCRAIEIERRVQVGARLDRAELAGSLSAAIGNAAALAHDFVAATHENSGVRVAPHAAAAAVAPPTPYAEASEVTPVFLLDRSFGSGDDAA